MKYTMKITATKIKLELVKNYGWASETLESNANKKLVNVIISDTLDIINNILIKEKGGKIK